MPEQAKCEVAACDNVPSVFDHFYKKQVCQLCFMKAWQTAKDSGYGEWFEKNYDRSTYPESFWKQVGAFVDLSRTEYKLRG